MCVCVCVSRIQVRALAEYLSRSHMYFKDQFLGILPRDQLEQMAKDGYNFWYVCVRGRVSVCVSVLQSWLTAASPCLRAADRACVRVCASRSGHSCVCLCVCLCVSVCVPVCACVVLSVVHLPCASLPPLCAACLGCSLALCGRCMCMCGLVCVCVCR